MYFDKASIDEYFFMTILVLLSIIALVGVSAVMHTAITTHPVSISYKTNGKTIEIKSHLKLSEINDFVNKVESTE